jgi:hypothetical protein
MLACAHMSSSSPASAHAIVLSLSSHYTQVRAEVRWFYSSLRARAHTHTVTLATSLVCCCVRVAQRELFLRLPLLVSSPQHFHIGIRIVIILV